MPGTLVSGNMWFYADIGGFLERKHQTTLSGRKQRFFSDFGVYMYPETLALRPT